MAARLPRTPSEPAIRTCVGCGIRAAKSELLRVVSAGGQLVPDELARLPGRGAYLHRSQDCLDRARRRRVFPRALRVPGPVETGVLSEYLVVGGTGSG